MPGILFEMTILVGNQIIKKFQLYKNSIIFLLIFILSTKSTYLYSYMFKNLVCIQKSLVPISNRRFSFKFSDFLSNSLHFIRLHFVLRRMYVLSIGWTMKWVKNLWFIIIYLKLRNISVISIQMTGHAFSSNVIQYHNQPNEWKRTGIFISTLG